MDNLLIQLKKLRIDIGRSSINEFTIPQQQSNIGITEKNVLNLKLNKNNVNTIKLPKNGSKKVGASGNQEKMDMDIQN